MNQSLADEPTVIGRILDHIDCCTTDLSEAVWREPVENYTSISRFEAEVRHVMRRMPTPFCPSAALPEAGSYVARDAALVPIVAIRGRDGQVRAFRNACRHRAAQVVPDGTGCKAALTCRYHGWTYGLDGALRGVPHEHGFPDLDKASHGLIPVKATEKQGVVFIAQDGDGEPDDVLPELFGPEWRLVDVSELEVEANWKIVTEGVLEGYHIRTTHAETFFPRQYDNLTLVEPFGRHTRMTYPFQNIERLRQQTVAARRTAGVLTHVYHLFPNAAVSTFPAHRFLTVFEPLAINRTRLVSYQMSDHPEHETEAAAVQKGLDLITQGTIEDREMQAAVQRGLSTAANKMLTFGLFEGGIARLHRHLGEALGSADI